jgi:uncharacterized RDD family membrane protein YckC
MKCPKCGYLGFDHADSCRNCGYEFSLNAPTHDTELPLRMDSSSEAPFEDPGLALSDPAAGVDLDRIVGTPAAAPAPSADPELPLFESSIHVDDEPLIKTVSAPRPPLAVRRSTPDVPRVRPDQPRVQSLELDLDEPEHVAAPAAAAAPAADRHSHHATPEWAADVPAGVPARLFAVIIDLSLLITVDVLVVYFTLQICGLTLADLGVLPKGPLIAFLLVQNGGYLVAFTAGGQTLGKMAAGIRVIPASPGSSLDVGQALMRELMWLILAIPAGLGFLSAFFDRERRGLHDRFAGTRVIVN